MRVGEVTAHLQPLLGLVVRAQSRRVALVARAVDDTRVVEVTQRCVEVRAVRSARYVDVVLLTERGRLVDLVEPVVGLEHVLLSVVGHHATLLGQRVELAVGADQVLAFGIGHDVVAQTAGGVRRQQLIGCQVGLHGVVAVYERVVVVEGLVVVLVVLTCVVHDVVVLQGAGVDTPLAVEGHGGITGLGALGRHHDDTVGTAGTVQGVRGGILQDADRLDVGRVQVVDIAFVGHAVNDPQRRLVGIQRAVTADVDRLTGTRATRSRVELYTGDLADQGILYVGRLRLDQVVRLDDFGRSGEGLFLGRTECHDDHVVDRLRIFLQRYVNRGLAGNGNQHVRIAHERHLQGAVCRGRERVAAVHACGRADMRAVNQDRRADNRVAFRVGNCTRDLPVLSDGKKHPRPQHSN